jgi:N-acyl-D-glutamate deacylase
MSEQNEVYDIVLANGRVIDPETYLDGKYNVGIMGDQIAAVSDQPLQGKHVIDVSGLIVSPGFIDTHAHGQSIPSNRMQAFDGVTTVLELEAGILPVGEFYENTAKEGRPLNFGASSGWGYGRCVILSPELAVDGKPVPRLDFMFGNLGRGTWVEDIAEGDKLEQILELTEQGLKEGGIGIGVPWGYAPGATLTELDELWKMAAKYGRPTYTHVQNLSMLEPNSSYKNHIELMGLAAATGAHTHVCHLNSTSLRDIPRIREVVRNAQAAGLPVTTEAYVWGAGNSGIAAAEFNPDDIRERLGIDWSDLTLSKNLHTFSSKEEFVKARTEHPADLVIVHFLREDDRPEDAALLDMSVLFPGTAICTDAIGWSNPDGSLYWGSEWPLPETVSNHPRASGNYTRFLRKWVREREVLSWMDAIRQCALNACLILEKAAPQMKKKGRLQEGMDADIVVFDPKTVSDKATFQNPRLVSEGMKHVIVNGTFVIRDEVLDTGAMPGRAIRSPIIN